MIWIVGNKGMLGSQLADRLSTASLAFVGSDREVDITDPDALAVFAADKSIDCVINCAAYTAVDRAEAEPELARALNVEGARNLARLADERRANIVHISTDYVFRGDGSRPYREDDPPDPTGIYGLTKAEGETAVLGACERAIVLRTGWLYGRHGPNFVYTMLRLMRQKDEIGVVADQRGVPTWTGDLSLAILRIIHAPVRIYGIYHFTGHGETSWYEFAVQIHRLGREKGILERDCRLRALATKEYPTPARRPAYSVLSTEKIAKDYGIDSRPWKESLEDFFTEAFAGPDGLAHIQK